MSAVDSIHTDLLRKMSVNKSEDPRVAYPALNLTGNVISATFAIPRSITFDGNEWYLTHRRGTSALFDSFNNLSSPQSQWRHTLVGWTGEIKSSVMKDPSTDPTATSKASAPIPVDPDKPTQPQGEGIWVNKSQREKAWQM